MAFLKKGDFYQIDEVDMETETPVNCKKCSKRYSIVKPATDILCSECGTITKLSDYQLRSEEEDGQPR